LATCIGFPPLCTVGAAELEPPASGRIALFSTAIEFDVFSSPWPEVAAGEVVQLVSGFCPVVAGCAMAAPVSEAARTATAIRSSTQTSGECELVFSRSAGPNVATQRWFRRCGDKSRCGGASRRNWAWQVRRRGARSLALLGLDTSKRGKRIGFERRQTGIKQAAQ
jgi:hypothetical protein